MQLVEQKPRAEDIDAHAGQRHLGLVRHARRVGRLFQKTDDPVLGVDMHHAKGGGFHARHLEAADGDVGGSVDVLRQHQLVVHLVDVVARQDHHELGTIAHDDVHVLVYGIGGAGVPLVFGDPLRGGQDVEALVALGPEERPAALQMADQAVRLVLRRDADAPDARVDRVGQGEIDDPGLAAEEHRGLGTLVGQLQQAAAAAAGEHVGHGVAGERARQALLRGHDACLPWRLQGDVERHLWLCSRSSTWWLRTDASARDGALRRRAPAG